MIDRIRKSIRYKPRAIAKDEELRPTSFVSVAKKVTCQLIICVQSRNGPAVLINTNTVLRDQLGILVNFLNCCLLDFKLTVQIAAIRTHWINVGLRDDQSVQKIAGTHVASLRSVNVSIGPLKQAHVVGQENIRRRMQKSVARRLLERRRCLQANYRYEKYRECSCVFRSHFCYNLLHARPSRASKSSAASGPHDPAG